MKAIPYLASLILLVALPLHAQSDEEQLPIPKLLQQLDNVIDHKKEYQARRTATADSLRAIAYKQAGQERISTLDQLYDLYLHYETGKALEVLEWKEALPETAQSPELQISIQLDKARTLGLMGFYDRAFRITRSISHRELDDDLLLHYYNTMHAILDWRADFALNTAPQLADSMLHEAAAYHDSLLLLEKDPINRTIIKTNKDYDYGNYTECIDSLNALMQHCNDGRRFYAYSRLSQAYGKIGETEQQLRYLTLTAMADLRAGITEYMALPQLAEQLYLRDDDPRAYAYLCCALDDANLCKSNLRTIQSSTIFPILEQANQQRLHREKIYNYTIMGGLTLIALLLAIGLFWVIRLNKKLHSTRRLLAEANDRLKVSNLQLQQANKELTAADKVKEDYLMKYLTRSRDYLGSIETMQRQVLKQVQARQFEELTKKLKSSEFMDEEQEKFYAGFDEAFLTLHPNFVQRFNELLKPDCAILPKKGELLTTELRIFALIRMGETDSTKLARFLNYSLTTIYNYRSRVRNNALGDKEKFEEEVMKL